MNLTCIETKPKQNLVKNSLNKCDRCSNNAIIFLPYGKHSFCKEHFIYFFEKRVKKHIRQNKLVKKTDKIVIAVSGGKDSIVVLNLLKNILPPRQEIIGLSIDEGIRGYRDIAIKEAVKNYKKLGIEYKVIKMKKEFNFGISEMVELRGKEKHPSSCAMCGVFRRKIMNDFSKEINADKLVTGHNLDDETQSITMSFFENDWSKLVLLGAITQNKNSSFVPRIKPLRTTPEQEVLTYAFLKEFPHYSEECCPFSGEAKRNYFRSMLNKMEENLPGTKFSILNSFKKMEPLLSSMRKESKELKKCSLCNAITTEKKCKSCKLVEYLQSKNSK